MQRDFKTLNKDGKTVWEPGLPALVTSRRVHKPARIQPTDEAKGQAPVPCDLKITLKLTASAKAEWLQKAMRAISKGGAKAGDVFNIVTHPKFVSGVPDKFGRRMLKIVLENMEPFSDKQRLTLSKCKLAETFQFSGDAAEDDKESAEDSEAEAHRSRQSRSRSRRRSPSPRRKASRSPNRRSHEVPEARTPAVTPVSQVSTQTQEQIDAAAEEEAHRKLQEQEKQRALQLKKALREKEDRRKAKLGSAFQFAASDDEDETQSAPVPGRPTAPPKDLVPASVTRPALGISPATSEDARFVEAMGGDKVLVEAHKLLRDAAGTGRLGSASRQKSRSPSRPRKRRRSSSSSRSPPRGGKKPHVRSSGSYRSPTPNGRARGQARAARKAKMMASMMGIR
mmetsp:Transcript_61842/g.109835  ORF Transcript_61842/g.109835 Transcript_61842/m.109835 type:complete len:396 (-) Transcript_61842:57-1244(-)